MGEGGKNVKNERKTCYVRNSVDKEAGVWWKGIGNVSGVRVEREDSQYKKERERGAHK